MALLKQKTGTASVLPPETPVTFYHYKEPLRRYELGFGFVGALCGNEEGTHVQCNFCGYLFKGLNSHLKKAHGVTAEEYKDEVGLTQKTALIGEATREKMVRSSANRHDRKKLLKRLEKYRKLNKKNGKILSRKHYATRRKPHQTDEYKNIRGTCPDQLLDVIKKLSKKLGRSPSPNDLKQEHGGRYLSVICSTFGTWKRAVKLAGLKPAEDSIRHTDEQLLEYMRNFYATHGRSPTSSDMIRGLLPAIQTYTARFGNLNNARELAGIPRYVPEHGGGWRKVMEHLSTGTGAKDV